MFIADVQSLMYNQPPYDSAALALFAAMSPQPSTARKTLISNCIKSLKAGGVWAKLDMLYVFANETTGQALIDWRVPTRTAQGYNSPVFTADLGYTGDKIGTAYIDTNWSFAAAGNKYALDDCHLAYYCPSTDSSASNDAVIGGFNASHLALLQYISSNVIRSFLNRSSGTPTGITVTGKQYVVGTRGASAASDIYNNGSLSASYTTVGTTVPSVNAFALARSNSGVADQPNDMTLALVHGGGDLTDAEVSAAYLAFKTYLTALGITGL